MEIIEEQELKKTYIVTRMISPNYFYLYNPYNRDSNAQKEIDESILNEVKSFKNHNFNLKKADLVAFYWSEGKRYIRCEIDEILILNNVFHYILFSLDYGTSVYTTSSDYIYPLPEILRNAPTAIMGKISLEVLPTTTKYDFIENQHIKYFASTWTETALKIFQQSINRALLITFKPSKMPEYKGFIFGDLMITTFSGRQYSLSEVLVSEDCAAPASSYEEFFMYFDKTNTSIERWNDYLRTGGVLKYAEEKLPINYNAEIIIKDSLSEVAVIAKGDTKVYSIEKVWQWKENIKGYEDAVPYSDTDSFFGAGLPAPRIGERIQNLCEDEGFKDGLQRNKSKRKSHLNLSFAGSRMRSINMKKLRCINQEDGSSVVSGLSKSVSQIQSPHEM